VKLMGLHNVNDYLNDPDVPEQQLMPMLEQAMQKIEQMNQQMQELSAQSNPDMIRAKAQMAIEDNRGQLQREKDAAAYDADLRKFMLAQAATQERFNRDMLAKLTEMDLKYNGNPVDDIPGTLEDNAVIA
jgi:ElaB/YqjD/DUF883 family membrane-anchored ribosome-binding protein